MKRIYIYIMCSLLCTAMWAQDGLGTYLRDVIQKQEKGILVTAKLIEACDLCDSLDVTIDNAYEELYNRGAIQTSLYYSDSYEFYAPEHRYIGYTLFAETDEFWEEALGKNYKAITAADVAAYIQQHCQFTKHYLGGSNYSNPENMLYQFVTYHLLNRQLTPSHLVEHINESGYTNKTSYNDRRLGVAVCDYYTTMGDRRLLRAFESAESEGICLNRFPRLDNARHGTYHELSCDPDKVGIRVDTENATGTLNAVIYPISGLLTFDQATAKNMGSIRLRMDVASFFPEMATNDIRLSPITDERHMNVYIPCDIYPYLEDLTVNNNNTKFCYWTGYGRGWANMQGDEFTCRGLQDITLRLPPVPQDGTYELRMATQSGGTYRGTFQIYFGTDQSNLPELGWPVDFRQSANQLNTKNGNVTSYIGYEEDTDDDMYDQLRDYELHEQGFMKGCNQYMAGGTGASRTMHQYGECLRRVIGKVQLQADKTYYLRLKNVLNDANQYLYMDYIELCPKAVYDNPDEPEDIW
ncbi:MAG: hypothetical protein IJS63_05245 [Bacteroidaceae bacterium]|nr:hypothetical protein [Bacteroidaceae bacterium]